MIMTSKRCEKIESIFFEALKRPNFAERAEFLDEACAGVPDVRREVDALLHVRAEPDSFLDRPIELGETAACAERTAAVTEGQMIGRYKLLQQLGEGGFGTVFMAEQSSPVRRKVAIKLIKPGMDSKEIIARFEAERQALAIMDHPNIAKVLDAGTTDLGRPYFVMDLVKGVSLTEYCDANNLSTRHRLQLFVQVCRAVQHAHQKGIIHRDLKPANIMVTLHDGEPVPKVIDFGVSKALSQQLTEKTLFTRYGQLVGTPQYMSPEQAELSGLDVDTRSDIYSLGVLLYELLTGRPPFPSETLREAGIDGMRRMIREQEPAKPSTCLKTLDGATATIVASHRASKPELLQKAVTGELDWIVMKALEKNRNRRYDTAGNLVDDIQRHLNDEPVIAGPPTLQYQLAKVFRRHRVATLTAATIAASLLVGLIATSIAWQVAVDAIKKKDVALTEQAAAITEKETAIKKTDSALAAEAKERRKAEAEKSNAEESLDLVKELFSLLSPSVTRGNDANVREVLDEFAQRLDADPPRKKEVEIEVRMLLGSSYKSFSVFDKASNQFVQAEKLGRQVFEKNDLEFAGFLFKLARDQRLIEGARFNYVPGSRAGDLLREARQICESLAPDGTMLIEILCELGDRQRACLLTDSLKSDARESLSINPYLQEANELIWSDQSNEAKGHLDKALEFARLRNNSDEMVLCEVALSDLHRYVAFANAIQHSDLALQELNETVSAETLHHVLEHRIDLEFDRPEIDDVALRSAAMRIKQRMTASWPRLMNLPRSSTLVGYVAGALMSAGAVDDANETLNLLDSLSGDKRNEAYHYLALWTRRDGELGKTNLYLSTLWDKELPLPNPWTPICLARGRFHARDRAAGIKVLQDATDWLAEFGEKDKFHVQRTSAFIQFEKAVILRLAGLDGARQSFRDAASEFSELHKLHPKAWGDRNPSILLLSQLFGQVQPIDQETLVTEVRAIDSKQPLTLALRHAALGQWALEQKDTNSATSEFIQAMKLRSGRFEQVNMEWVNEQVVKLLTEKEDLERLEQLLVEDVQRRDKEVAKNHPERAYVRIRLVEMMHGLDRSLESAEDLLSEAKRIYAYHGEWIPKVEHEKLEALTMAITQKLNDNRGK